MAAVITQIQSTLTVLPQCAQTVILDGITTSSCGLDIACICRDDNFLTSLQSELAVSCNRHDQAKTFAAAKDLCLTAIPSLAESRGGELVATVTVLMIIATIAVILRLYARKVSGAKFGTDDYLIVVALILTFGLDTNSYYSIKAGTGRHMITLGLDQIESFIKTYVATQILFGCSITATKLSILFFYNRLFPYRTFYIVSLATGIVSILWWIGLMLTAFLHCQPFAYNWDRSIPNGHCVNDNIVGYTITSINIVTDLVVLVLPIPWLWGMNMAVPKRMAVVGLFVLGSFVCIAGVVRIPFLSELQVSDATYTSIRVGIWVIVECNIGILSACLPILRPLFSSKYTSSPVSLLARIFRTLTNSRFSSSSRENLTSDPEKGSSEPSSDATMAGDLKWPNDSTAGGGWKWGRNNSGSVVAGDAISPVAPGAEPTIIGSRRTIPLGERQRKQRTWYTAAAEMLPEIDLQKRWSRKVIDTDTIPRYRDDEKPILPTYTKDSVAVPTTMKVEALKETNHDRDGEEGILSDGYSKLQRSKRSSAGGFGLEIPSVMQSQRSSWGRSRDTWDLMPSVVFWDRGGLVRAMDLR